MECVIETKASTILEFVDGLRGNVHVTFGVFPLAKSPNRLITCSMPD